MGRPPFESGEENDSLPQGVTGKVAKRGPRGGSEHSSTSQQEVGMTRTDVVASSRPQTTVSARSTGKGSPRVLRRLLILPVALLLGAAFVAPGTALAAETGSTGYAQKPPEPTTTPSTTPATTPSTTPTSTTPTPTSGTSPSKESNAAAKSTSPSTSGTSPSTSSTESAKELPFTGFDLRWTVGFGLLLMGVGFLIV